MDDVPASVSRKIVTNLLRYDLGFRGVIVTDGLQMQALAQYTDGEKAVLALAARKRYAARDQRRTRHGRGLEKALDDGTLSRAALDRACCVFCSSSSRTALRTCRKAADLSQHFKKAVLQPLGRDDRSRQRCPFFLPPKKIRAAAASGAALIFFVCRAAQNVVC